MKLEYKERRSKGIVYLTENTTDTKSTITLFNREYFTYKVRYKKEKLYSHRHCICIFII